MSGKIPVPRELLICLVEYTRELVDELHSQKSGKSKDHAFLVGIERDIDQADRLLQVSAPRSGKPHIVKHLQPRPKVAK